MTQIQQALYDLISQSVLPDVEDYMDELFEIIAAKKETEEDKQALSEMQEMKDDFTLMLKELENDELDDEECLEIFEEIKSMIEAEQ
jgi:hypothetical protein